MLIGLSAAIPFSAAQAQPDVAIQVEGPGFGIRVGPPVYAPPAVFVPAPAYVSPPVIAAAPLYLQPRVIGFDGRWREEWRRHEWREHEWREHEWRERGGRWHGRD
ncbi:MAG TPA: hypothetical protein VF229_05270 [Burkholderiaceae bacterium]